MTTFTDDTDPFQDTEKAKIKLQKVIDCIVEQAKKLKIKLNKTKLTNINLANTKVNPAKVINNGQDVRQANKVKYLSVTHSKKKKGLNTR